MSNPSGAADHVFLQHIVEISPTNASARTSRALEVRKATLASILRQSRHGVRLNEHLERHEGNVVFAHACKWDWRGLSLSAWARP